MSENNAVERAEPMKASALEYLRAPWAGPSLRLLVVLAHPDDEVLALGGRLEWLTDVAFTTVTDGAPRNGADAVAHGFGSIQAYQAARRAELLAALRHAGLGEHNLLPFPVGVPDQQASFYLPQIVGGVLQLLQSFRPDAVLTHPYEGGHPDHDACAFAVHTAAALLGEPLAVLEAPFYQAGTHGEMRTGYFLPGDDARMVVCSLDEEKQANKRARLACFASQAQTLAQFGVEQEMYRGAPTYDFLRRPHEGKLLYEHFDWGMQGDRFCELARAAQEQLLASGAGTR